MASTTTSLVSTPRRASAITPSGDKTSSGSPSIAAPETFPPSPGTFRHPRFTEIVARQSATSVSSRSIQSAAINIAVLLASIVLNSWIQDLITIILKTAGIQLPGFDTGVLLNLFRLYLVTNTVLSLRPAIPYISKKDEITDIPLTPSQRALFGLNVSPTLTTTAVPNTTASYITPPRYRHVSGSPNTNTSNTPTSTDRRSISANYSGSPLSTSRHALGFSPSPATGTPTSSTPFSPLLHRAVTRSSNGTQEGSPSRSNNTTPNLGRSQNFLSRDRGADSFGDSTTFAPGTPSPSGAGKRAVPGVNYKWLYDKGIGMPGKN